ncbi:MAG: hypothetical protein ACTSRI_21355 [Promethearchaeota archaeon]
MDAIDIKYLKIHPLLKKKNVINWYHKSSPKWSGYDIANYLDFHIVYKFMHEKLRKRFSKEITRSV